MKRNTRKRIRIIEYSDSSDEDAVPIAIVNKREVPGDVEYLVKWSDDSPDTWVASSLLNCDRLIISYERSLKARKTGKVLPEHVFHLEDLHDPDVLVGLDNKFVAEQILGVTKIRGKLMLLIKWRGVDDANMVPAQIANVKCPQLVIKFYEKKIKWS